MVPALRLRPRARMAARRRFVFALTMTLAFQAGFSRIAAEPSQAADAALTKVRLQLR